MRIKPLVTACLLGTLSVASPLQAESLLEIYNLAIDNDPKFLSSGALFDANIERGNQSLSSLLPSVSANYGNSYNKSSGSVGFVNSKSESITDSLSLSLNQTVYDYSTWVSYDQSQRRVEQAKVQFNANKQELIVRVAQVYLDVLGAKDNLEFAAAEQKAIKQELEQTKQRYDVGLIAITGVHEAQARYDQSEADRINAQNRLDNADEALREVTGRYHR